MPSAIAGLPRSVDDVATTKRKANDPGRQNANEKQRAFGTAALIVMASTRYQPRQKRGQFSVAQVNFYLVNFDDVFVDIHLLLVSNKDWYQTKITRCFRTQRVIVRQSGLR